MRLTEQAHLQAAPVARGTGLSQAIYYAPNVRTAAAGTNKVTVTFSQAAAYVDVRITEYSGLDLSNPLDKAGSASGSSSSSSSGSVTTTSAIELVFGAGMTDGNFTASSLGFTTRIITSPDADIVFDRVVGMHAAQRRGDQPVYLAAVEPHQVEQVRRVVQQRAFELRLPGRRWLAALAIARHRDQLADRALAEQIAGMPEDRVPAPRVVDRQQHTV